MIGAISRVVDFLSKLESDSDFVAKHRGAVSYDDLGALSDSADLVGSLFERFDLDDRETAHRALATISKFVKNCEIAAQIASNPLRESVGAVFQGVDTSLAVLSEALNTIDSLRRTDIPEQLKSWLLQSSTADRLSRLKSDFAQIGKQLDELDAGLSRFCELGGVSFQQWWGETTNLAELARIAEEGLKNQYSLSGWLEFKRIVRDVSSANLSEIAKLAESRSIAVGDLIPAYRYVFYNTLGHQLTKDRSHLLQFAGLRQEAARERFVELDKDNQAEPQVRCVGCEPPFGPCRRPEWPGWSTNRLRVDSARNRKKEEAHTYQTACETGRPCPPSAEAMFHDGSLIGCAIYRARSPEIRPCRDG